MARGMLLCSGGAMLDQAWRDVGNEIVLQCEKNRLASAILKAEFPEAIHDSDIRKLTRKKLEAEYHVKKIEETCFIGGLCCTPFSYNGNRKGKEHGEWLVDELVRLVDECQPRLVVSENVRGFIDHVDGLSYLARRLSAIGYSGESFSFPASALGAYHQRQRVFSLFAQKDIMADTAGIRRFFGKCQNIEKRIRTRVNLRRGMPLPGSPIQLFPYGHPKKSTKNLLKICGNGVDYGQGYFVASVVKAIHDAIWGDT